jgi:predicted transposase YbfD/YdcC
VSPSQSSISRFFKNADEQEIKKLYLEKLREKEERESAECAQKQLSLKALPHYAIDGKSRGGCVSELTGRTEIDLTIFNVETRTVIGLEVIPDKEGEATSAQKIFKDYGKQLPRGILTADAGFTSPKLIVELRKLDFEYIIGLKGNAGKVFEIVEKYDWSRCEYSATTDEKGHGREEKRKIRVLPISAFPNRTFSKYSDCAYIICIDSFRTLNGVTSIEKRFYIASKGLKGYKPEDFLSRIRAHWIQENGLHWCKDAILGEDNLPKHSHRSSRLLGFLKSIVVSIGYEFFRSVQKFKDNMVANPKKMMEQILFPS